MTVFVGLYTAGRYTLTTVVCAYYYHLLAYSNQGKMCSANGPNLGSQYHNCGVASFCGVCSVGRL